VNPRPKVGNNWNVPASLPYFASNAVYNPTGLGKGVPVAQVAYLRRYSKDVRGCSTAPYEFILFVRNEEVADSIPVSSTHHGSDELNCAMQCASFIGFVKSGLRSSLASYGRELLKPGRPGIHIKKELQ
jgi:hypothetical protein